MGSFLVNILLHALGALGGGSPLIQELESVLLQHWDNPTVKQAVSGIKAAAASADNIAATKEAAPASPPGPASL